MRSMDRRAALPLSAVALALLAGGLMSPPKRCEADGGPNHQTRNLNYGVSGGNAKDISKAFCCGGTIGSLLEDSSGNQLALSNNHVFARTDSAAAGEDISQPGLIDNRCRPAYIVADFTAAPKLGTNVDAAVASVRSGQMVSTGYIEDIGTISSVVKPPAVGLAVQKSGRTSGQTTGSVSSINTSVSVQYQKGCNSGKKLVVSYTNQVVISSSTFSVGGDSGSLIVTNDACKQPVALLFAGSSTTTIGNPIGEVLSRVGAAYGQPVSFVGDTCSTALSSSASGGLIGPSDAAVNHATQVMRSRERAILRLPSVLGVGVGSLDGNQSRAAIVVYIDSTQALRPFIPRVYSDVPTKVVFTDPFVAR